VVEEVVVVGVIRYQRSWRRHSSECQSGERL
jgi:hypothetical protein